MFWFILICLFVYAVLEEYNERHGNVLFPILKLGCLFYISIIIIGVIIESWF